MALSHGSTMVRTSMVFLVVAALTAIAPSAMAAGALGLGPSDSHVSRPASSMATSIARSDSSESHSHHRIRGSQRRRPARIIIVPAPSYYYSPYYFVPGPTGVNASYFCLAHAVGFVSRVGLLDHLGGTHKFALEHAAAICPADVDTCVFDGLRPLY